MGPLWQRLGITPSRIVLISRFRCRYAGISLRCRSRPGRISPSRSFLACCAARGSSVAVSRGAGLLRQRGLPISICCLPVRPTSTTDPLSELLSAAITAEPGVDHGLARSTTCARSWRRAAVAVLPSIYGEGVPKALLEAAACARPIVATDMPGCREVVRLEETGLLVPAGDIAALAAALAGLAAHSRRAHRDGMRRAASLIEREFGEETVRPARPCALLGLAAQAGRAAGMTRIWPVVAGLTGAASVIAGCVCRPPRRRYQDRVQSCCGPARSTGMIHAATLIALIAIGARSRTPRRAPRLLQGWSLRAGIVLFSGSLFALAAGSFRGGLVRSRRLAASALVDRLAKGAGLRFKGRGDRRQDACDPLCDTRGPRRSLRRAPSE